ncbi:MAG TPA: pantoate--beta-alanine ligase [Rhizomicrobium sp.]|nr:pantoate--beta-alanine ligase [Rhizomicrobium sp.]
MTIIASTVRELRAALAARKAQGHRIGLVPTMGALHDGHVSLVTQARAQADTVVVSIFVNPTQFAPHEDFDAYPRTLNADLERLGSGAEIVFTPTAREIYPDGHATTISVAGPALGLESDFRPHFFAGVATVVAKLLIAAGPDIAVFGEKDYQQLLVIKRLAADLALPVQIVGAPTLREADGLAMSSRNAYLSLGERKIAARLNAILKDAVPQAQAGHTPKEVEIRTAAALKAAGFEAVDYVAIRDAETLARLERLDRPARILAATKVGKTRLIDNMPLAKI